MIVEYLLEFVLGTLGYVLDLLPDDTVPWPDGDGYGQWIGALVGPMNAIAPLSEMATIIALTVTVVLPAVATFRIAVWVWGMVPVIGGKGG